MSEEAPPAPPRVRIHPRAWPVISASGTRQHRPEIQGPPAVRWWMRGERPMGRLSGFLWQWAIETVGEPLGVIVHQGVGKDRNKFALEFVIYEPKLRGTAVLVKFRGGHALFVGRALTRHQMTGASVLRKQDDFWIGWWKGHEPGKIQRPLYALRRLQREGGSHP